MRSTQFRRWVFLLLALAAAIAAGQFLPGLNQQRVRLGLMGYTDIGDAPPGLVLATTALGPMRAISVDVLWLRAIELQEQGKFFELVQLFDWISKLQPRFPGIWIYAAWNLAYNVSVNFPPDQPEQRWRWVQRGIELLRDKGIPNNRNAAELYRELGWMYFHKIGDDSDEAHHYYKVQLAIQMEDLLGRPPHEERLQAMADMLEREKELLNDPGVSQLLKDLKQAGIDPFDDPLAFIVGRDRLPEAARAVLKDRAGSPELVQFDVFFRAWYLSEKLLLRPRRMHELMESYGPIDWRLADAHSLYWGAWAVELEKGDPLKAANKDRMVFSSLLNLYDRGTLRFKRGDAERPPAYLMSPHFGFLERVVEAHKELAARYKASGRADPARNAYLDFLRDTVLSLYVHNNKRRAAKYLRILQTEGHAPGQSLEEFVRERFRSMVDVCTKEHATTLIVGFLFESLFRSSVGQFDVAVADEQRAKMMHRAYNSRRPPRTQLGPFNRFREAAMMRAIQTFRPFQVERLRELFPKAVQQAEKKLRQARRPPRGRP